MRILGVVIAPDGRIDQAALDVFAAARQLAADGPHSVTGVVIGADDAVSCTPGQWPSTVYVVAAGQLGDAETGRYADGIAEVVRQAQSDLVLLLADRHGEVVAPVLAALLGAGMVSDCTDIGHADGALVFTRTVGRGLYDAQFGVRTELAVATIAPHAFAPRGAPARGPAGPAGLIEPEVVLGHTAAQLADSLPGPTTPAVAEWSPPPVDEADVVVGIGRGVSGSELAQVTRLARLLGAGLGASRQAIENGNAAASDKIGDTGKRIGAEIYLAIGISGANQHMSGIGECRHLIAINSDPAAPIFGSADLGVVADSKAFLPLLCEQLERRLAGFSALTATSRQPSAIPSEV